MGDEYAGVILSCRRSMRPLRPRYCPMKALGEDATMSRRLVGWEVGWALEEPKIRDTTGGAGPLGRVSAEDHRTGRRAAV